MTDLQLLVVLETLVKLAKSKAPPGASLSTIVVKHGAQVREELAKLDTVSAVTVLHDRLKKASESVFAPAIVEEAVALLEQGEKVSWLIEVAKEAK